MPTAPLAFPPIKNASLEEIHGLMGHYGAVYLDLQKARIGLSNRVSAYTRLLEMPPDLVAEETRMLTMPTDVIEDLEHQISLYIVRLAKAHPMRDWIERHRGIGLQSLSVLFSITRDLWSYPTVSALWKYMGMAVLLDGRSPRRTRGKRFVTKKVAQETGVEATAYNPAGRVLCHQIGDAIVKVGGEYRAVYDNRKAKVRLRERVGPSKCYFGETHKDGEGRVVLCGDAHSHNDAMRVAVKALLRDLWVEWRHVVPKSEGSDKA